MLFFNLAYRFKALVNFRKLKIDLKCKSNLNDIKSKLYLDNKF